MTSCASHYGTMTDSASLSQANFTYAQHDISGEAKATYIFGFGGMQKKSIVDEAKRNMLSKVSLGPNQTIANVSVNYKNTNILIFGQTICTVTADVVEFKNSFFLVNLCQNLILTKIFLSH